MHYVGLGQRHRIRSHHRRHHAPSSFQTTLKHQSSDHSESFQRRRLNLMQHGVTSVIRFAAHGAYHFKPFEMLRFTILYSIVTQLSWLRHESR